MLPKKNRADKKSVERIFKEGRFVNSPNLSFKFIVNNSSKEKKVSFIVPKSVTKEATKRTYLRRRGYIILKKYFSELPLGVSAVFIFKRAITSPLLEEEIKTILRKL